MIDPFQIANGAAAYSGTGPERKVSAARERTERGEKWGRATE